MPNRCSVSAEVGKSFGDSSDDYATLHKLSSTENELSSKFRVLYSLPHTYKCDRKGDSNEAGEEKL